MRISEANPDGEAAWVTSEDVQRMLSAAKSDAAAAEEKLNTAVRWRKDTLEGWLPLRNRLVNTVAIGRENRPLIYTNAAMQRGGDVAPVQWAAAWDEAIQSSSDPFVKLDFVVDVTGFQPLLNLDIRPFIDLLPAERTYFAERIHRIVIIDTPTAARYIWKALRPLLPSDVVEKIFFVSRKDPQQMESLYELASSDDMRRFLIELIEMGGKLTSKTSPEPLLGYIDEYQKR
eukprot:gnl/TRDRNA2_/TRDRNA2_90845_c0_seq2.p1 gnl/TRDRNA2_/TRDRNA2_90845_c0~~gnl/TRDRNA2_/TRDRNA2_90845_c0_seq2.p1  ORF type:complete len:231 (+),score=50.61 gnl/TRDRNA2_/TRDRNA2_90845_c0_seq2:258-950(+)